VRTRNLRVLDVRNLEPTRTRLIDPPFEVRITTISDRFEDFATLALDRGDCSPRL